MFNQLLTEQSFTTIISNQQAIIGQLESSDNMLTKFLEISEKYYTEAEKGFKEATSSIGRIRSNFDAIYKTLKAIKGKQREVEELRLRKRKSSGLEQEIQIQIGRERVEKKEGEKQEEKKQEIPEQKEAQELLSLTPTQQSHSPAQ